MPPTQTLPALVLGMYYRRTSKGILAFKNLKIFNLVHKSEKTVHRQ